MSLWSKVKGVFGRIGRGVKKFVAAAGAPIGAAIGSIVPGVGTAIGGTIGGALQTLANKF